MKRAGFTLIELLIVITTIGIIVGIAIPSMRNSIRKAKVMAVIANMRVLNNSLHSYAIDNSRWPKTLNVNTLEPLVSDSYLRGNQVRQILTPLIEERLGAYVLFGPQKDFLIFYKMKIFPKIQFYLMPDGVYIKNPETNVFEKFTERHMAIILRQWLKII